MIDMLKRHEIQVLRRAEHTWSEIATLSGVSEKHGPPDRGGRPRHAPSITRPSARAGRSAGRRRPRRIATCSCRR